MKEVEFFQWWIPPNPWSKKPYLSSYKMDRKVAEERYPGATPYLVTREVRNIPETPEERKTLEGSPWKGLHPL